MPGRAIIEIAITNTGGTATIDAIRSQMDALGVSVLSVKDAGDQQDRTLQRLLDSLEPARVATEKLSASQQLLKDAYDNGKISQDRFSADLDALNAKYATSQTSVARLGSAFDGLSSTLSRLATDAGAAAGVGAIVAGLEQLGVAAAGAEVADARLTTTWTANAGAMGASRQRLDDLAQSLADLSGVSVLTEKRAESLGLTFHDVTGPTFERMIADSNDMAAVMGTDVTSAVERLGRAMENPTAGLNALTRSDVAFTQAQKEQIKAMADAGDLLGAQSAILDQVEARYKGAAATIGGTVTGDWNKFTNAVKELEAELGKPLLPFAGGALESTTEHVRDTTEAVVTWKNALEALFENVETNASPFTAFFQELGGGSDASLRTAAAATTSLNEQLDSMVTKGAALAATGLNVFFAQVASDADKEAKALNDLLNKLDPYRKALQDSAADVKLLTNAKKDGAVTDDQFNNAMKATADALEEARLKTGMFLPALQDLGDKWNWVYNIEDNFYQHLPDPVAFDKVIWGAIQNVNATATVVQTGSQAAKDFQRAFTSTLTEAFSGDFAKAWQDIWKGLAKTSADIVSTTLFGKAESKDAQGNVIAAVPSIFSGKQTTTQTLEGAGALVGGYLSSQGQQSGNQTEGALGGALSGAVAGFAIGGPTGAIVGAVVGGVMGYFGSQGPSKMGYNFTASSGGVGDYLGVRNAPQQSTYAGVDVGFGGPDAATMKNMAQQLSDKAATTAQGLNALLTTMNQSFENPAWSVTVGAGQKTTDVSTVFNTFLNSTLPQTIFAAFEPYLKAGMTGATAFSQVAGQSVSTGGLGISSSRANQELAAVANSSDFTTALAALQTYIQAVVNLNTLNADLGKTFDQLKTTVLEDSRAAWQDTMTTTLSQIATLSKSLDQMTSAEQVANAQQIYTLTEQQYQNNLKYLQQILQAQQSVDQSFTDMFAGFNETTAKGQGTDALATFYETQLTNLADQLKAATSPEAVQTITSQMQKYGESLWNMNYQGDFNGGGTQAWVQQFLQQQQTTADAMLQQWAQDTAAANTQLQAALANITTALGTQVGAIQNNAAAADAESAAHQNLTDLINQESAARDQATTGLVNFTNALNAAAVAAGWA